MKIEFLIPAQFELDEAVSYYNSQKEGLGFEFAEEVKKTLGRIVRYPEAWTIFSKRTRRCRTKRFPYGIIYHVGKSQLFVVAVMHLHQQPKNWENRLS